MLPLAIIIPAYNEENTISQVLKAVQAVDFAASGLVVETIVVDDGSSDRTADIVAGDFSGLTLLRHASRQGKGAAVRTALAHCKAEYVIIQDADREYDPQDIPRLMQPILEKKASVVYGSRFARSKYPRKMLFLNYLGNFLGTAIVNLLYAAKLTDLMTCYKVLPRKLMSELDLSACGFDICPEITTNILLRGISIEEVPISYHGRTHKQGKKIKVADSLYILWTLIKNRFFHKNKTR